MLNPGVANAGGVAALAAQPRYERLIDLPDDLLDVLPAAVYVCDAAGLILRCNRKAVELWGRTPKVGDPEDRFCGSWRLYRLNGALLPHAATPMAEALRTGRPVRDQEVVIERPDGSRITVLVNIAPLRDAAGAVIGAVNCFLEITSRKRAEEALREQERYWRTLLEALPVALYTTDAAGRITFFNRAAAELWRYCPELGTDKWCGSWRLYWPDGRPLLHDHCPMAIALKEGRPIAGAEAMLERPDGTRVPFLAFPTPLHDAAGALVGAVNMLVDISERKRAHEFEQRLAAIVESSDDAIVGKDLDGVITSWNRGAEQLFGYTAQEAVGKPITMLIPPDRHDEEPGILGRIRRGERVDHYETVRRRKDGSLVDISLTVSPIKDAQGRIVGASKIARDITERKQAEERTRLLAREVDHRAKNMLATVQAITRMMQADSVPAFVEALGGRLLAMSRAHTLLAENRWCGADLERLVGEEMAAFGSDDGARVSVSGPRLALGADAAQPLAMALHELATNAAKYGALSQTGGRIAIEWSLGTDGNLVLGWTETGGPPARKPSHRGFGTGLIEATVAGQLEGEARFDWRPTGLVCTLSIPAGKLAGR